eukprot:1837131-Amphidinium_carterae.1
MPGNRAFSSASPGSGAPVSPLQHAQCDCLHHGLASAGSHSRCLTILGRLFLFFPRSLWASN